MGKKAIATSTCCVIIGFLMLKYAPLLQPTSKWIPIEFIRDLGIAFIIAAILLTTVEIFTKTELLNHIRDFLAKGAEEIREAEFSKTLSDRITQNIFQQVDQFIIKRPYLLKNMKVNLEFQASSKGYLKLVDTTFLKFRT